MLLEDTDLINLLLDQLVTHDTIEPIDENNCHPMDWAEVTGLLDEVFDDIYSEDNYESL
jgi:hypothetical protein